MRSGNASCKKADGLCHAGCAQKQSALYGSRGNRVIRRRKILCGRGKLLPILQKLKLARLGQSGAAIVADGQGQQKQESINNEIS